MKQELILFSYDFPHYKSQEILMRLHVEGYPIKAIIAAPWRQLNRPVTTHRDAPSYTGVMHTRTIAERFGIPYIVAPHTSDECMEAIRRYQAPIAIIAGAQILRAPVLALFSEGVINTHEAMLPWLRGLDTLKWSIYYDLPMANSIHFVDESIDQGRLIYQEKVELKPDDTLLDISLRFMQAKPGALVTALKRLETRTKDSLPSLEGKGGKYGTIMPPELIQETLEKFPAWLQKHAGPAVELDPFNDPYAPSDRIQQ